MKPAIEAGITAMPSAPHSTPMPCPIETEKACISAPQDQTQIATENAALVPILSTTRPANSIEIAYTNWKAAAMLA